MITSLVLLSSIALQLPAPVDANALSQPTTMTRSEALSSCATNTFVVRMIADDLKASVGYAPRKDGPLVLEVRASTPRLDTK